GAPEAREKMHNAGTIAGMAFGNAFLGIVHAMSHTLGATFHIAHGRTNAVLLPHVIRYNGTVPAKLTGWPKYESYRAPERFQDIARTLGLPAATPAEGVESLAVAVERLREAVGIEPTFRSLGVDEETFLAALPQQALNAYEDQCAPANPRMPMLDDMRRLMRDAYHG
ncbi:iron-containing alcohol dehydrogenase, partial [Streptomyces fragilis]